jgi:hypothetical protein
MKFTAFLLSLVFALPVFACTEDGKEGFLPENNMYISVDAKNAGGISEAEFNLVIDRLSEIYAPIISQMGGKLDVSRGWSDGTVNASAQRMGSTWRVNMYGGLARHATITSDGFALVMCHELGHHLGGAPKVGGFFNRWASNEGQSDYFATLKCLRKMFLNDDNAAIVAAMKVPEMLSSTCAATYADENDKNICIRNGMAGVSVSNLFASMRSQPPAQFNTPDPAVVSRTNDSHPAHQCRLDTYYQGALCDKSFNEDVAQNSEVTGTCHGSLGDTKGLRPLCWFKPTVR